MLSRKSRVCLVCTYKFAGCSHVVARKQKQLDLRRIPVFLKFIRQSAQGIGTTIILALV